MGDQQLQGQRRVGTLGITSLSPLQQGKGFPGAAAAQELPGTQAICLPSMAAGSQAVDDVLKTAIDLLLSR